MLAAMFGVPQGSNLEILLFPLSNNDLLGSHAYLTLLFDMFWAVCFSKENRVKVLKWCTNSRFMLSLYRCKEVTFRRTKNPAAISYILDGLDLTCSSSVRDLGKAFDWNFCISYLESCVFLPET